MPDLERSDQFDTWDCISQQSRMYIELKARRNHYTELLIEKSKYESLTITAMRKNYTAWYINATPLGLWAFNLTKLDKPVWKDNYRWCDKVMMWYCKKYAINACGAEFPDRLSVPVEFISNID